MNRKNLHALGLCFISLTLVFASSAHAKKETFKVESHQFSVDVPDKWQAVTKILGVPAAIVGPVVQASKRRPVLAIAPMGTVPFKFKDDSKNEAVEYRRGREAWLTKLRGKAIEFLPYKFVEPSRGIAGYSVGYSYLLGANEFSEKTFYVVCDKTLYSFQTLSLRDDASANNQVFDGMLKSFRCGKGAGK